MNKKKSWWIIALQAGLIAIATTFPFFLYSYSSSYSVSNGIIDKPLPTYGLSAATLFVCTAFISFFLLSHPFVKDKTICMPEARKYHLCRFSKQGVLITCLLLFFIGLPIVTILYPGIITRDGINQLYQYAVPAPTFYSSLEVFLDGEYIDHHPIFDTLIYGFLVFDIGDGLLHSQNRGMFLIVLLQHAATSFSLGLSLCYLEKLGIPQRIRFLFLLLIALFPLFPLNATNVLKDVTHAPFFALFFLLYVECIRSKGNSLDSPTFVICFILIATLCILTKKTGLYIVIPSTLVFLFYKRNKNAVSAISIPALLTVVLIPGIIFPLLGGVVPGGRQEMLALPIQQVTTVIKYNNNSVNADKIASIGAVMDINKATKDYTPFRMDPTKECFYPNSTASDLLSFFGTYFSLGIQHPTLYLVALINCDGPLIVPSEPLTFYKGIASADIEDFREKAVSQGFTFPCKIKKGKFFDSSMEIIKAIWDWLTHLPLISIVFTKGFYGWVLPIFCFLISLSKTPQNAVCFIPILLAILFLLVSPVDNARYCFPLLYTAPTYVGLAASSLIVPKKTNY